MDLVVFSLAFPRIRLLSMMCFCLTFIKDQNQQKIPFFLIFPCLSLFGLFFFFACSFARIANISVFSFVSFPTSFSVCFLSPTAHSSHSVHKFTSISLSAKNCFNCCERFSRANCFSVRSNISLSRSSKRALVALARNDAPESSSRDDTAVHLLIDVGSTVASSRRLVNCTNHFHTVHFVVLLVCLPKNIC